MSRRGEDQQDGKEDNIYKRKERRSISKRKSRRETEDRRRDRRRNIISQLLNKTYLYIHSGAHHIGFVY